MPEVSTRMVFNGRYTRTQISLHWLVVLLIIGQWYTSSAIPRTHSSLLPPSKIDLLQHAVHIYAGLLIGIIMLIRFGLSYMRTVAPFPTSQKWQDRLARIVHLGLYFSVLHQVAAWAITSYFWAPARLVHAYIWKIILVVAFFHIVAAVYHLISGDGMFGRVTV